MRVEVMSRSQHMMDAVMIQECTQRRRAKRVGATIRPTGTVAQHVSATAAGDDRLD